MDSTPGAWLTVVGVAPNIVQDVTRQRGRDPIVYLPYRQRPGADMWVFAKTRVAPAGLVSQFRHEVQVLDPDLPVWLGPYPLSERLAGSGAFWIHETRRFCSSCLRSSVSCLLQSGLCAGRVWSEPAHSRDRPAVGDRRNRTRNPRDDRFADPTSDRPGVVDRDRRLRRRKPPPDKRACPSLANDPLTYLIASAVIVAFAALGSVTPGPPSHARRSGRRLAT